MLISKIDKLNQLKNAMGTYKDFTVEQGLQVQAEHLARWEKLLKPEVFADLKAWTTKYNSVVEYGHQVTRGVDLDSFISNYLNPNYTPSQKYEDDLAYRKKYENR